MLEIFSFYINIVVQIFNRVLQSFEVTNGVGFGTFLLASSLLVVFINLLKFRFASNGFEEILHFRDKEKKNLVKVHYWDSDNVSYLKVKRGGR